MRRRLNLRHNNIDPGATALARALSTPPLPRQSLGRGRQKLIVPQGSGFHKSTTVSCHGFPRPGPPLAWSPCTLATSWNESLRHNNIGPGAAALVRALSTPFRPEREFFIDNLLVHIHSIIKIISVDRPCAMGV